MKELNCVVILSSLMLELVSGRPGQPVPASCGHLRSEVKNLVKDQCNTLGHSHADGDESSCGGLSYDITEPCEDDLYCLRKYLNVVSKQGDLMQKICGCLDVFKVVVSQRNKELCPGGRFFNPFDGADKAFNVATDIDVHILRKIGGIVDDIEASFGQKKEVQYAILNKLQTITDPVRLQEILDKIRANLKETGKTPKDVMKVVDTVIDVSVHNMKKLDQQIDDIEAILKAKLGLQSSILDKLRTIFDADRKEELDDNIVGYKDDKEDDKGWSSGTTRRWKSSTTNKASSTTKSTTKMYYNNKY